MTTRTTPSPIEIIADVGFRTAAEAGALVVALDTELTTVLLADAEGGKLFGASDATLRQIRSAARTLAETGRARVSLRRSTRAGTQVLDAALAVRPEAAAVPSFALLTISGLGRPADDDALLATLFRSDEAGAVFTDGRQIHATQAFAGSTVPSLAERIARFEAGSQDMSHEEEGNTAFTLARAPFGRIVALVATIETPALATPEPEAPTAIAAPPMLEAPAAGFATFSVKRPKLGEARPGMSMGALLQRWHSRGPETDVPPAAESAVPDSAPVEMLEPVAEAPALSAEPATTIAEPNRGARLRSKWGQAETAATDADVGAPAEVAAIALDHADASEGAADVAPPQPDAPRMEADDVRAADALQGAVMPEDEAEPCALAPLADDPTEKTETATEEGVEALADVAADETQTSRGPAFVPRFDLPPVRFVWQIDRDGAFRFLSPDFVGAVGPNAADVVGRSFATVSRVFGFDETREIARLLERRDTWSGRTIFWPVEGSDRKVPVDLAALPVYGRDRSFDGFRGFGIVRLNESVEDEEALGLHLTQGPAPVRDPEPDAPVDTAEQPEPEPRREKPFLRRFEAEGFGRRTEQPAATAPEPDEETDQTQKVIRLEERRRPREGALSTAEEAAFRAIGAKLANKAEAESPGAPRFEEPAPPSEAGDTSSIAQAAGLADDASAAPAAATSGTDGPLASGPNEIEPALEALSEKLARAEAEADRRLAARRTSDALTEPAQDPSGEESQASRPAPETPEKAADGALIARSPADAGSLRTESPSDETVNNAVLPNEALAVETVNDAFEEPVTIAPAESSTETHSLAGETDDASDEDEDDEPPLDLAVFERLFAGLPLAVLVQVREHTVYVNAEFALLTGHADAEAVEAAGGLDTLVLDRQGEGTLALLRADGEIVEVHGHMQRIAEGGRSALLMSFQRVADEETAAGPALEDLRKEVEELQAVLDTATDGVVLLDSSGHIRAMNGSAHALFGIGADEAFGRHLSTLFAHESQKATVDYLEMLRDDGIGGILNDGREVIGRVSQGGFIPLFITIGRLSGERGWCVVIRDIAHWKRIEEDLVNARRQAEAASLHKSRFLANISHELRTPLNAIIGFADVMSSECFGPIGNERYLEYLGDIKRSGHHVLDLVNDLLDISKIEAGKVDLSFEAVSLNEVISEAVSLMQPQANRERVIVRSNLPSSVPPVVADRRTMRQIALNLLANAIRFTPAGGQIIASTTYSAEGDVLLRFRDSGIGMTEREIELALTPFQQVHAPSANRGEGTGLGLPLTKAMVEANRAYFSIQSTPGEGTLVEIVFPAPRVLAD